METFSFTFTPILPKQRYFLKEMYNIGELINFIKLALAHTYTDYYRQV